MNMGSNPINLVFRFLLELAALFAFGYWGWNVSENWFRYLLVILAPLLGAVIWGTFAVPDDPSRSGKAPITVPGWLRLILEWGIFGLACVGLIASNSRTAALILLLLVIIHYALSVDRIRWLIKSEY